MKPGTLIAGKYRLKKPLGDGAMGLVWSAINERTEREVALKLLQSSDPDMRRRLLREAKACGRLSHRTIVEIYDVGETDEGEPFLVMQLLHGETLGSFLKREGKLSTPLAAGIALDVARALAVAHDAGVIHRDLKPANIFLHRDGDVEGAQVKVLDFGVSKLSREIEASSSASGNLIGSPAYMSPEQAKTEKIDGRADLWSLGVVLYEMLAGERPFKSQGMVNVLSEILLSTVPRLESVLPSVDRRLADVVARCLERDLDKRVQSAAELTSLLAPFAPKERYSRSDGMMLASGATTSLSLHKEVEEDAYSVDEYAPTAVFRRGDTSGGLALEEEPMRRGPDSGMPTVKRSPNGLRGRADEGRDEAAEATKRGGIARSEAVTAPLQKDATTSTGPVSRPPLDAGAERSPRAPEASPPKRDARRFLFIFPLISVLALIVFGLEIRRIVLPSAAPSAPAENSALVASIPPPPPNGSPSASASASASAFASAEPIGSGAATSPAPASTLDPGAEPSSSAIAIDPIAVDPAASASAKRLWGKLPKTSTPSTEPTFKVLFPMPGDPKK